MNVRFKKGRHRARPLYWLRWWPILFNPAVISRRVIFTHSSKYELPGGDQEDHNKLFGVGFLRPHNRSARFCWRWDQARQVFILSAYLYINGARYFEDLCDCVANHYYDCHLRITETEYQFTVRKESGDYLARMAFSKGHGRKLGLLLGPYFGGNRPAPKDLTIQLKKI